MQSLNISRGGLKLEANFNLQAGEFIDLSLLISGTMIRCRGMILAVEEHDRKVLARVRFTRASNVDQRKLSDYLQAVSMTRLQKGLIGGLFILAGAILAVMIGYNHYFQSGHRSRVVKEDISARRASDSPTKESEPSKGTGTVQELREATVAVPSTKPGVGSGKGVQEISEGHVAIEPPEETTEFRAQSTAVQDSTQGPRSSRPDQPKPGKVSKPHGEDFPSSSGRQMGAMALSEGEHAGVARPVIQRSVIGLGVEDREPVGVSQRVSVRQGRVYCWAHVINGKGGTIVVRWLGGKGQRMAEVRLAVDSNNWRTWSYLSLKPSMIGPAQVEILDENGEMLERLSFEITE